MSTARGPVCEQVGLHLFASFAIKPVEPISPLVARFPRHRIKIAERICVRAVVLPARIVRIPFQIASAPALLNTQGADSLKIMNCDRELSRDFSGVEFERGHTL